MKDKHNSEFNEEMFCPKCYARDKSYRRVIHKRWGGDDIFIVCEKCGWGKIVRYEHKKK